MGTAGKTSEAHGRILKFHKKILRMNSCSILLMQKIFSISFVVIQNSGSIPLSLHGSESLRALVAPPISSRVL